MRKQELYFRHYNGYIHLADAETAHKYGLIPAIHKYRFGVCGELGNQYTYQIVDDNGNPVPEYQHIQFSRTRNNRFLLSQSTRKANQ